MAENNKDDHLISVGRGSHQAHSSAPDGSQDSSHDSLRVDIEEGEYEGLDEVTFPEVDDESPVDGLDDETHSAGDEESPEDGAVDDEGEGDAAEGDEEDVDGIDDEGPSALKRYLPLIIVGAGAIGGGGIYASGLFDSAAPVVAQQTAVPSVVMNEARPQRQNPEQQSAPVRQQPNFAMPSPNQSPAPLQGNSEQKLIEAASVQSAPVRPSAKVYRTVAEVSDGWFVLFPDINGGTERIIVGAAEALDTENPRIAFLAGDNAGKQTWRIAFGPFDRPELAQDLCQSGGANCRVVRRDDVVRPVTLPANSPAVQAAPQQGQSSATTFPMRQPAVDRQPLLPLAGAGPFNVSGNDFAQISRLAPPMPPEAVAPKTPTVRILGANERAPSGWYAWFATIPSANITEDKIREALSSGDENAPPRVAIPIGTGAAKQWRLAIGPMTDRSRAEAACKPIIDAGGSCLVRDQTQVSPPGAIVPFVRAATNVAPQASTSTVVRPAENNSSNVARTPQRVSPPQVINSSATRVRDEWKLRAANGDQAVVSAANAAFDQVLVVAKGAALPDGSVVREIRRGSDGMWEVITDRGVIR